MQGNPGMSEAFFAVQCSVMMSRIIEMLLTCNATCRYIPAEVLKGDVSDLQKADIFMLGITLYELATNLELPTGKHRQITAIKYSHLAQCDVLVQGYLLKQSTLCIFVCQLVRHVALLCTHRWCLLPKPATREAESHGQCSYTSVQHDEIHDGPQPS